MATLKELREKKRNEYFTLIMEMLSKEFEDVVQTKSNTFAFPILLDDRTEDYLRVVISIPTGTKGEPYDPNEEHKQYLFETERKAKEKAEKEEKKKAKAKADAEKRAKAKAIHEK